MINWSKHYSTFEANPQEDWQVESLAADGTTDECKRAPKDSPLKQGLVTTVTASSKPVMKRGPNNGQTHLFPPMWISPGSPVVSTLRLQEVTHGARALFLNLGSLWMKVSTMLYDTLLCSERSLSVKAVEDHRRPSVNLNRQMRAAAQNYLQRRW